MNWDIITDFTPFVKWYFCFFYPYKYRKAAEGYSAAFASCIYFSKRLNTVAVRAGR